MASSSTYVTSLETEIVEFVRERERNSSSSKQYPYPSHVNATSFISIKLSSKTNYRQWREQMIFLVEGHGMLCFVNGTLKPPREGTVEAKYEEWKRSDLLVKGWILDSLSQEVMATVVGLHTANDVWEKLKATYSTPAALTTTTISIKKEDHSEIKSLKTRFLSKESNLVTRLFVCITVISSCILICIILEEV